MIAKLIVHGRDRAHAIARMREALNGFVIRGISSNIPFQAALLAHPKFVAGDFNTGFIAEHYAQGLPRRGRAARRPAISSSRWRAFMHRTLPRARVGHQRAARRATASKVGEQFVVVVLRRATASIVHKPVSVTRLPRRRRGSQRRGGGRRSYKIDSSAPLGSIRVEGTVNGAPSPRRSSAARARIAGAARRAQRHADRGDGAVAARRAELLQLMPLQGAAGPEQVPAVADAGPAGRGGGAAGPAGAGRREAGGDRGDEDGERARSRRRTAWSATSRRPRAKRWRSTR